MNNDFMFARIKKVYKINGIKMKKRILYCLLIGSSHFYLGQLTHAGGELTTTLPTIKITASSNLDSTFGVALTSSQGTISKEQIETRPLSRPAEVLETIPGVIVTQHSGSGKANQYFLRGFNLDHGTDFATSFDEQPINMVSHAHGQGYTDLNFLIPELIESIQYHKGAVSIDDGDFASAGTAKISSIHSLDNPYAQITLGNHNLLRFLAVGNLVLSDGELIGAVENINSDGPWVNPENLSKQNVFLKYFSSRPLIEDNSVRSDSSTLVNLQGSYQFNKNFLAQVELFNVFDQKTNDIEYYYASCTRQDLSEPTYSPNSSEREGIYDRHIHPTEGRNLRMTFRYLF